MCRLFSINTPKRNRTERKHLSQWFRDFGEKSNSDFCPPFLILVHIYLVHSLGGLGWNLQAEPSTRMIDFFFSLSFLPASLPSSLPPGNEMAYIPGWPPTHWVADHDLELLPGMFLPSPPRCWANKCALGLCSAGDQIQGMLGKCSPS